MILTMKKIWGFLAIVIVCIIFYLTFQGPSETMGMSEKVRIWLNELGIVWKSSTVRSNAHLPEYFALGMTLCLWGGWKKALLIGASVGIIDETIRIILPTRHFDFFDLLRDFAGILAGILVVLLIRWISKKLKHRKSEQN